MKKKSAKVGEAKAAYGAKKRTAPAAGLARAEVVATKADEPRQIRYATPEQVRKATEKIFRVHHELFRKLAQ